MFFTTKKLSLDVSPWKIAVEVMDRSKPLSKDNIGVCCQEFHTTHGHPWTKEKLLMLKSEIGKQCDVSEFETANFPRQKTIRGVVCSAHEGTNCKVCKRVREIRRTSTGPGFIKKMVVNINHRNKKKGFINTITYNDLRLMILRQRGLCSITSAPMVFKGHAEHFKASVERADPRKGYFVDNMSFCIMEMNVPCNQTKGEQGCGQGQQWTRAKFLEFARGEGWTEVEEKEQYV
jgi:hypothetical protein